MPCANEAFFLIFYPSSNNKIWPKILLLCNLLSLLVQTAAYHFIYSSRIVKHGFAIEATQKQNPHKYNKY
jgi:hypothetical protein